MPRLPFAAILLVCACAPTQPSEPAGTTSGASAKPEPTAKTEPGSATGEPGKTVEPVLQPYPGTEPDVNKGMISCYYPEIPDAPTLQLWLVDERGSSIYAMASSAGGEDPEPGKVTKLFDFKSAPAEEWPLGVYSAGPETVYIEATAAPQFERESWSGRVVDAHGEDTLSCSYYPGKD